MPIKIDRYGQPIAGHKDADLTERILEAMHAGKKIHAIGDRAGRTFCDQSMAPLTVLAIVEGDITCDRCLEMLSYRRVGLAKGTYKSRADAKLDEELGIHRPPTQGT